MSSGYGSNGGYKIIMSRFFTYCIHRCYCLGVGRCYPIWRDFALCMKNNDNPTSCTVFRDDYFECLHRNKEMQRHVDVYRQVEARKIEAEKEAKRHGH